MKLLVVTQAIDQDNPILGFFHRWVEEFAKHCERVTVICLERGKYSLPENVKVLSLGKETGQSRLKYLFNFYKYIWQERKNYDAVFVHMNQIYVILGGWFWHLINKRVGLWYVHRQTSFSLWLAEKSADEIFTATPEGFNLRSGKLHVLGHGILTDQFRVLDQKSKRIMTVGRITRIKNLQTFIQMAAIMEGQGMGLEYDIIGPSVTKTDESYQLELRRLVAEAQLSQQVHFWGGLSHNFVLEHYGQSALSVNLTPTGGIDKVVLESMAMGVVPLVSNQAFRPYLAGYDDRLIFSYNDAADLAQKAKALLEAPDYEAITDALRASVKKNANLATLIRKIIKVFSSVNADNPS